MIAYLLSTGDEVLMGDIVDTNVAFIAGRLKDLGIRVQKTITVGDEVTILADTISAISKEAQLCIVTGGLGPTQDDLTAMACSRAAGVQLEINEVALESMQVFFRKRGFELTPENKNQAMLPKTADILINEHGTAPGFFLKINQCLFMFLPGVPAEMKAMFELRVIKNIKDRFTLSKQLMIERLTVFGLGESKVGALLAEAEKLFPEVKFGFRARFPVIEVKLIAALENMDDMSAKKLSDAKAWAIEQLTDNVISKTGLSPAQEVGRLLTQQNKTVAAAESCTGGLIANLLTNVSGSSDYFLLSCVTYSNDAKMKVLGVKKETIIANGAVHELTAKEMAVGARQKAGADFAISTTGVAGPAGGTGEKPVGMVCIGFASASKSFAKTYTFPYDDRMMNKQIFATTALEILRRQIVTAGPKDS